MTDVTAAVGRFSVVLALAAKGSSEISFSYQRLGMPILKYIDGHPNLSAIGCDSVFDVLEGMAMEHRERQIVLYFFTMITAFGLLVVFFFWLGHSKKGKF